MAKPHDLDNSENTGNMIKCFPVSLTFFFFFIKKKFFSLYQDIIRYKTAQKVIKKECSCFSHFVVTAVWHQTVNVLKIL